MPTIGDAVAWMDTELPNLHAAVDFAALRDQRNYAAAIPMVLHGFLRTPYCLQSSTKRR